MSKIHNRIRNPQSAIRIDVLTLFPAAFAGPLDVSILGRAREAGLLDLHLHDIREHALDRHRSVDDYPFGGGQGMVMRADVLDRALDHVQGLAEPPGLVVYLTPQGERLDDRLVRELAREPRLVLVCGRYEGVDERFVEQRVDREVSIGDFVLTGGELPAMVLVDAVTRHVPGALGDAASPEEESFAGGLLEYPQYTRPAEYRGQPVPAVLLGGDHAAIAAWRAEQRLLRTARRRPELLPEELPERPARKAAGATIRAFRLDEDSDLLAAFCARVLPALPAPAPAELRRLAAHSRGLFLAARSGRRVVGVALGGWDGRAGRLYALAVEHGRRGQGLGAALLDELEARLRLLGCTRIEAVLTADASSDLRAFLEGQGWTPAPATVLGRDLDREDASAKG